MKSVTVRFLIAATVLVAPVYAQAPEARRGEIVFLQCRACHSLRPGETHKIGPNLAGVAGAPAAAKQGFGYSLALKAAKLRWTDATLDAFLLAPLKVVPGNKMAFAGLKRPEDRRAIIAHLKRK